MSKVHKFIRVIVDLDMLDSPEDFDQYEFVCDVEGRRPLSDLSYLVENEIVTYDRVEDLFADEVWDAHEPLVEDARAKIAKEGPNQDLWDFADRTAFCTAVRINERILQNLDDTDLTTTSIRKFNAAMHEYRPCMETMLNAAVGLPLNINLPTEEEND
jgi:hypothetical protein